MSPLSWFFAALAVAAFAAAWTALRSAARRSAELRAALDRESGLHAQISAAEEARKRTLAVLESMAEGVAVVDADQRVLVANPALSDVIGAPRVPVEARYYWEIFRDADLNEMIDGALSRRTAIDRQHVAPFSGLTFHLRISPVFREGDFLGVVAVFHDVTRLKELEKARTEFVANVSHELKTPLTSILGFIETLKEGAVDDAENRLRFLSIIEEHSKKLHRLIEDLLHLSRIESGADDFLIETLDLEQLSRHVLDSFDPAIRAKRLRVDCRFEPKPFLAKVDAKSIEEALSNLIDNAVKYNEIGGSIEIFGAFESGAVTLAVRDTGIGIPAEDLKRVFERFYRVDKSRSRESGGSGLGLAISKHIAERHGGSLSGESSDNKGSTFTLRLPR